MGTVTPPSFTDYLRDLDDGDLTVYEHRYLLHIWRRGSCWETPPQIAKLCNMSRSQAYRAQAGLIKKGCITNDIEGARVVQKVTWHVPVRAESIVVTIPDRNEYNVAIVPGRNDGVPGRDGVVPGRDAIPINRTKEINTLNDNGESGAGRAVNDEEREANRLAIEAVLELVEFWHETTQRQYPPKGSNEFKETWFRPFNSIWIKCGRDVGAAKAMIQAVRNDHLSRRMSLSKPTTLLEKVQEAVDRELIPMTERFNGNGRAAHPAAPVSVSTPAPGSQPVMW